MLDEPVFVPSESGAGRLWPQIVKVVVANQVNAFRIGRALLEPARSPRCVIRVVVPLIKIVANKNHSVRAFARNRGLNLFQVGRLVDISYREKFFHAR